MHSASKYLNGHSDVLAGATLCAQADSFWQRVRAWRRDGGAVLGPFEAWLLLRGMRTLYVRVQRNCQSAMRIAEHFQVHPLLSHVLYPGLPDHPGHAISTAQMQGGFGGMLSIRHAHGEAAAVATAANVAVFKRATSLGGVESLIEHRASIEGPSTPVPADLLRLSIGLENVDDLIADLEQALESSASVRATPVESAPTAETSDDPAARIEAVLADQVRPLVQERGGDVALRDSADGVVTLTLSGSPGASMPIKTQITAVIRHYLPTVRDVVFAVGPAADAAATPADRVRYVLAHEINPAVASHGGRIVLREVTNDTAYLAFEGGCQGCAMADVTLRQGVEVILKERVPEIVAIVDVTDHAAGTDPYFKTKKGPA